METGGHPDCDVCAAVDVHYLSTGGARAAALLAADAAFAAIALRRRAPLLTLCVMAAAEPGRVARPVR